MRLRLARPRQQLKITIDDPAVIHATTIQGWEPWEGEDKTEFRARANALTDVTTNQTFEILKNGTLVDTITILQSGSADFRGAEGVALIMLSAGDVVSVRHTVGDASGTDYEITLKEI